MKTKLTLAALVLVLVAFGVEARHHDHAPPSEPPREARAEKIPVQWLEDEGHDQSDPNHWYPLECCHGMDCAPADYVGAPRTNVSDDGVPRLISPGLEISSKHGSVFVPDGFPRRRSKDSSVHVCMRPNGQGGMRLLCVFFPDGM